MNPICLQSILPLVWGATSAPSPNAASITQSELFDTAVVHEIAIDFDFPDWYDVLADNKEEGIYVAGTFTIDGVAIDSVGVRFKGNSSYNSYPGIKKPFRIKFSEYREDQKLDGLPSIMLNNGYKDPTILRETIAYDLLRDVGMGSRTGFANLTVNDELIGIYTIVETLNGTWIENHVASSEDGNLWEGEFRADLTWLGADQSAYESRYVLETNEEENDYSQLIDFIDKLNHTPIATLPDTIAPVLDVDTWLRHHAVHNLMVNMDAYEGPGHNFYMYWREDQDRITHIPWDQNMAFGTFTRVDEPPGGFESMSALYEDSADRPFLSNILDVDLYQEMYLRHMRDLLSTRWTEARMGEIVDELAAVVRTHIYADPNKMYSDAEFEQNLDSDVPNGRFPIFGLKSFVGSRIDYLVPELSGLLDAQSIFINELMADNESTVVDDFGEFDDYAELYNAGGQAVSLAGYGLTDDHTQPFRWTLPATAVLPAGGRLVVWLDATPAQGDLHAPFGLNDKGEELFLFDGAGELVDFLCFDRQGADDAWGRYTDGSLWIGEIPASPDAENSDAIAPSIEQVVVMRGFPAPGRDFQVTATVTENTDEIESVDLIYDAGSGFTTLSMIASGDTWSADIPGQDLETLIDYYVIAEDVVGRTATLPSGAPAVAFQAMSFVGRSPITINELMADNATALADEQGEYDDWIELANVSGSDFDLGGYTMSDDEGDPSQWAFPAGTVIPAFGYLLIWADGDVDDEGLHASFKLGKDGEFLGLYGPSGGSVLDTLTFGAQTTDLSAAREADGLGDWSEGVAPTPEVHNGVGGVVAVIAADDEAVEIESGGGSFGFQATVFNRGTSSSTTEAWTAAALQGGDVEPLLGPLGTTIGGIEYATISATQIVPHFAPSGSGWYELRVGEWGGSVESVSGFTVTKLP